MVPLSQFITSHNSAALGTSAAAIDAGAADTTGSVRSMRARRRFCGFNGIRAELASFHLNEATRIASSAITRALFCSAVPAGSPLTRTLGLDHTGMRGHPPQLDL